MDVSNQDEAERCRDLAKGYYSKGQYDKASRFYQKSLQLFPLPGVAALLEKTLKKMSEAEGGGAANGSSSGSRPIPAAAADNNNGGSSRPYTDEQESGAKKIIQAARKSHYEVLGLSRTASEGDVKKAYKKLALRFHPDKNSAPSAEGAFKAISSAVEVLGDASKREVYDQCGGSNESEQYQRATAAGHTPGFGGHEMSPEDIFNLFFQGQGGPSGFRMHFGGPHHQGRGNPFQRQNRNPGARDNEPNNIFQQLYAILPFLLIFLMSFSPFSQQAPERVFSFVPDHAYREQRSTKMAGVASGIDYYVTNKFRQKYGARTSDLYRVEKSVEREFREMKLRGCYLERENQKKRINRARWDKRTEEIARISAEPLPACDEYFEVFRERPELS